MRAMAMALLMEKILNQLIWRIYHCLSGFIYLSACRISSINSRIHPWKLTWHWKIPFSRGNTSSNGGFSIAVLAFRSHVLFLGDQCVGFFLAVPLPLGVHGSAQRHGAARPRNSWQKTQTGHICELIHCLLAARKDVPLPSLKRTAQAPENRPASPIGKDRIPTIHFEGVLLLVSGRLAVRINA